MQSIDDIRRANIARLEGELGTLKAVADLYGCSEAQMSQWKTGALNSGTGKPRGMRGDSARRLEAAAGKPMFWLDQDHSENTPGNRASTPIPLDNNPDYPPIRRVRFKLSAGVSGFGVEYLEGDGAPIVFQKSWYESRGFKPEKLFAVKVANGSMEPGLYDGDTVVVNTESTTPRDGVVFAVNYEGEQAIKRLSRDAGEWWLSSDNPDQRRYPRKVCHADTFLIGEVVHKQSERI